jgi:succinate dehydrogenase / fumarate reductase flavoprotein subunit
MARRRKKIVVVGGGLAGLSASMKLCELNAEVALVAYQSLKRSHSV